MSYFIYKVTQPTPILKNLEFQKEFEDFKDAKKYSATKGWGYARWRGKDLIPWGDNADFAQSCVACHTPVANKDYIFSTPAIFINGK